MTFSGRKWSVYSLQLNPSLDYTSTEVLPEKLRSTCMLKIVLSGLPLWLSGRDSACQCRGHGFGPWVGKTPWRRKWATHSNILVREIPWTEEPGGATSHGVAKELDTT